MNKDTKENGFVSIIVAGMIMIVLALITIGFTRIMQREQRQTLDRQLSRQALYAAESGINDIAKALDADPTLPPEKETCDVGVAPALNNGIIDDSNTLVAYTCALYDKTPEALFFAPGADVSKIVELKTESGNNFDKLKISWGNSADSGNSLYTCGAQASNFNASRNGLVPILRLDLTNTSTLTRGDLINSADNVFFLPCKVASDAPVDLATSFTQGSKGRMEQVVCDARASAPLEPCSVTIDLSSEGTNRFLARLKPIYAGVKMTITATELAGGVSVAAEFADAATSIDVTARANDVVRRLRVSIPQSDILDAPEAVFQSIDGVCKLLSVDISNSYIFDGC